MAKEKIERKTLKTKKKVNAENKVEPVKVVEKLEDKNEETSTLVATTNNFWGKLGGWVKEKVDCCLEG